MIQPNWLIQRTHLSSNKIALIDIDTDEEMSYKDLYISTMKWVAIFKNNDFKKGDRIAVISSNTIELFPILFACGIAGLIYVPLNFRLSQVELNELVNDCQAAGVIYHHSFDMIVNSLQVSKKICLGEDRKVVPKNFDSGGDKISIHSEDPFLMIYTGGTTGKPKGVVLSHRAVNFNAMNTIISWGLSEEDKTINYMPLFHTGGINALCMPILMAGGTVVIGNTFDANNALEATDRFEATISLFVPTMYHEMVHHPYFKTSDFSSMKVFLSGGAPCPANIYKHFQQKNLQFKEGYGLTEAGPNNFFIRPEDAEKKIGSVGKNMLFNEVSILNEHGNHTRINEAGELLVRGAHLFTHYWNNREATENSFYDGWFKTGDIAKIDEAGDYYILGRKKDMIITGGENVYPIEVEQCILTVEAVDEVAVVGIPDEKWGEKVVAYITLKSGEHIDEEELKKYCKKYLGTFKIPKRFFILENMPKTDVGKIDKNSLLSKEF